MWRCALITGVALMVLFPSGCRQEGVVSPGDAGADAAPWPDSEAVDAAPDGGDATLPDDCPWPDLRYAPAPVQVDGLNAVPVDLQSLDASLLLDGYQQRGRVQVQVRFRLGAAGGMPILDLRQSPEILDLDGLPLSPADFSHHDFGAGWEHRLRVLQRSLEPCSSHTLQVEYELGVPDAPAARPVVFEAATTAVRWDWWFTDLEPGRYLEMWLPANLIYDRFTLGMTLELRSDVQHTVISNGEQLALGAGRWQLEYPPHFTALSPLLVVRPTSELVQESRVETFGNGQTIGIDLYRVVTVPDTQPSLMDRTVAAVADALVSTGDYPHGDRLAVYVWEESDRSMEYDGGTTTRPESLEHELFHSWYGRGVRPALGQHGWLDEAWTVFNTDPDDAFDVLELPLSASPLLLDNGDPWSRITPGESYGGGRLFFGHLAFVLGLDELRSAMSAFYIAHVPDPVRTADLERHLYCLNGDAAVAQAFWRWVYGHHSTRDPATYPSCP